MSDSRPPLRARDRLLPLGGRTYVMAILNLTDNSFSGDGLSADIDAAVRLAVRAESDGADIVDIGAESARADVPSRDEREEAELIAHAIGRISAEVGLIVSCDTYKAAVAEAALAAGAHMINDIGGFMEGEATARIAARFDAALVLNYTVERPKVRPSEPPAHDDLIGEHLRFLRERMRIADEAGVGAQSLIADPGIAFGKSHDEDIAVLRRLGEFRALGPPILVAASRKNFIGSITGLPPPARDAATVAVTALSIAHGADIVRVHDVPSTVAAARVADAIVRGNPGDFAPNRESWPWAASVRPIQGTTIAPRADDEFTRGD